ncbi:Cytochrome C oxidase subunit IV, prokaryotes [Flavobacteriaceae bacterium]|jgi:hypothetical protein
MRKATITYFILLLLTVSTALISNNKNIYQISTILIMVISAIKFLLVAFQFMEIKKANSFWKVSLTLVLTVIVLVVLVIL